MARCSTVATRKLSTPPPFDDDGAESFGMSSTDAEDVPTHGRPADLPRGADQAGWPPSPMKLPVPAKLLALVPTAAARGQLEAAEAEIARLRAENERLRPMAARLMAELGAGSAGADACQAPWCVPMPPGLSPPPPLRLSTPCADPAEECSLAASGSESDSERALPVGPATVASGTPRAEPSESQGSRFHGTGHCKPCRWYWKKPGCQNGPACQHCHKCPAGELERRKRVKVNFMLQQARERDQQEAARLQHQLNGVFQPLARMIPPQPSCILPPPLPLPLPTGWLSAGSALHPSGFCKPCVWFSKPMGCLKGARCQKCHICSIGAKRRSTRSKYSAPIWTAS